MISQIPIDATNNFLKLRNKLIGLTNKAITDFNMVENNDRVLVCISGGKDSYSLLMFLLAHKERAPIQFDIVAMNLDQKQPGFPVDILPNFLKDLGIEYQIFTEDTYSIVKEKIPSGKTTCSLCSRLRREIIYKTAKELNINKIALGHHRDDIVETLFLNMFFGSKLKAMPPKLVSNDNKNIIIKPLAYCSEKEISSYASRMNFPIIPYNLCGSQENLQRKKNKRNVNGMGERTTRPH
jgi:tRNA 2-thiocytidine biosynthesis protein TtcA